MRNMLATLALYATLLFCSSATSNAQDKTPLFIFGDSLYDTGMSAYGGVKGVGAKYWPYSQKPGKRYSNGLVIPDFIAQFSGLPILKPYLLPGNKNYTEGVNFASATACVLPETCSKAINLKMQLDYFDQMVQILKQQVGKSEANRILHKAVYLFNIGENDYTTLLQENISKLPLSLSDNITYIKQVLGNLTIHIKSIYNQGGRKFAFQNIGPLGCMPSMKYMLRYEGACAPEPQELAMMHNAEFAAVANRLQSNLAGFKYSIYDFYAAVHKRVLDGNTYGFKESETACCGSGAFNGDNTCQNMGRTFSVCSHPKDYLWFDAWHPTARACQQFAEEFWSGKSNVVAPCNLRSLFAMG